MQSPSPLHHTFLLGCARFTAQPLSALLMTRHYPDLSSASDWLRQISPAAQPITSTTQVCEVSRHQYRTSALVPHRSFRGETSDGVSKLFAVSG